MENSYQRCSAFELAERGLTVETEVILPLKFKGVTLDAGYRLDIWVERKVILEVKSVESLYPMHTANC